MKLRMKTTHNGSPDGYSSFPYQAGQEYSLTSEPRLSDDLAAVFLREGWAEEIAEVPFREPESAPAVEAAQPEAALVVAEPAPPESSAAPVEAGPAEATPTPDPLAEAPAAENASARKKGAAVQVDPAPGSSEPS